MCNDAFGPGDLDRGGRIPATAGFRRDDRKSGFEVVQAAYADEAIAMLKVRPDIHVVFTDIQMPGSMV
jgi:hypothetical protein